MKHLTGLLSMLVLGAGALMPAAAAEPGGIVLGAGLNGAMLSPRHSGDTERGIGLELSAGYVLGPRWAVLAKTSGARLEDASGDNYTLGHLDLLGQYRFRSEGHRFQPHLEGGLTRRTAQFARTIDDSRVTRRHAGWGPTLGAGVSYGLRPALALQASLRHTFGEFSGEECSAGGDRVQTCATSTRLSVGFNWTPGRR